MKNSIFLLGLLGAVVLSGCMQPREKGFDVTGIVPPSQMREAPAQEYRPVAPAQTEQTVSPTATPATAPSSSEPRKVTIVPETGLQGKIVRANASLRFVVLNFPVGRMAAVDQPMIVYRQGQKVGEVKVTGPQQDDNIIADVTVGEAEVGDEVREK